MIINIIKKKVFPLYFRKADFEDEDKDGGKDEDEDEFYNLEETLRDIPVLKREESAEQRINKRGQGLKILTPDQMLSKLQITSAPLKAGKNSEIKKWNELTIAFLLLFNKID